MLGLHALTLEVARAVPDRLGLPRGPGGEDDQRRVPGAELRRGCRLAAIEQAIVGKNQDLAVEAGLLERGEVALVGHDRARIHQLHARAKVGRAQLLGARLGHRAEAPAGDHRVGPLGAVANQRHHDVAAADPSSCQRSRQPRRAVRHLAEGDLATLAVARQGNQRETRRIRGVHHVEREVHAGEVCT